MAASLVGTLTKAHPDGTGTRKARGQQTVVSPAGWTIKVLMIMADDRYVLVRSRSEG